MQLWMVARFGEVLLFQRKVPPHTSCPVGIRRHYLKFKDGQCGRRECTLIDFLFLVHQFIEKAFSGQFICLAKDCSLMMRFKVFRFPFRCFVFAMCPTIQWYSNHQMANRMVVVGRRLPKLEEQSSKFESVSIAKACHFAIRCPCDFGVQILNFTSVNKAETWKSSALWVADYLSTIIPSLWWRRLGSVLKF